MPRAKPIPKTDSLLRNTISASLLKKKIHESGVVELMIGMALHNRNMEMTVHGDWIEAKDEEGKYIPLEQSMRMSMISQLTNKVLANAKPSTAVIENKINSEWVDRLNAAGEEIDVLPYEEADKDNDGDED